MAKTAKDNPNVFEVDGTVLKGGENEFTNTNTKSKTNFNAVINRLTRKGRKYKIDIKVTEIEK